MNFKPPQNATVDVVITARGGSKRIVNKNLRIFKMQSLLAWSIKFSHSSSTIRHCYVSSDSDEILDEARLFNAIPLKRPISLSNDISSSSSVLDYVVEKQIHNTPDFLVLLQPTSPLREFGLIEKGVQLMLEDPNASSLCEVSPIKLFTGEIHDHELIFDYDEAMRSQDLPMKFIPTGRIYIYRTSHNFCQHDFPMKTIPLIGPDFSENINIDTEEDFVKLEYIYKLREKSFSYLLD
jgi:CMP-N,N'-diacetyllegionaminic acid synthase